jgi:hypothetical protein
LTVFAAIIRPKTKPDSLQRSTMEALLSLFLLIQKGDGYAECAQRYEFAIAPLFFMSFLRGRF